MGFALLLAAVAVAPGAAAQGVEDDERTRVVESVNTDLSLDRDNVLLALALDNAGGVDVEVDDLLEGDSAVTRVAVSDRDVSLDEDTVFSALALDLDLGDLLLDSDLDTLDVDELDDLEGLDTDGATVRDVDTLDALDSDLDGDLDVGAVESVLTQTRAESRSLDLDRDDVFLAIALENSAGGDLDFDTIADLDRTVVVEEDLDRSVDIDEDDAFLALALDEGDGGGDGDDLTLGE